MDFWSCRLDNQTTVHAAPKILNSTICFCNFFLHRHCWHSWKMLFAKWPTPLVKCMQHSPAPVGYLLFLCIAVSRSRWSFLPCLYLSDISCNCMLLVTYLHLPSRWLRIRRRNPTSFALALSLAIKSTDCEANSCPHRIWYHWKHNTQRHWLQFCLCIMWKILPDGMPIMVEWQYAGNMMRNSHWIVELQALLVRGNITWTPQNASLE